VVNAIPNKIWENVEKLKFLVESKNLVFTGLIRRKSKLPVLT